MRDGRIYLVNQVGNADLTIKFLHRRRFEAIISHISGVFKKTKSTRKLVNSAFECYSFSNLIISLTSQSST